jgi:hypothetical protein
MSGLKRAQPKGNFDMPKKQTSSGVSTLASRVLSGSVRPTPSQVRTLAATALGQDEKKGQGKKK